MSPDFEALERATRELGREIFSEMEQESSPSYPDKLMNWAMANQAFKTQLFRFVDVLPALKSSTSVVEHAQAYFSEVRQVFPGVLRWGLEISPRSIPAKMAASIIREQVKSVALKFIVGRDVSEALPKLRKIRKQGRAFTIDLLGEAALSEAESLDYLERYQNLIRDLSQASKRWSESAPLLEGHFAEDSPVNVSVKLSALYSQIKPEDPDTATRVLLARLTEIAEVAKDCGAFLYVDMEDSELVDLTLGVVRKLLISEQFKDSPNFGIVLQAYLKRTASDLEQVCDWVKDRGAPIAVRLVKGAYWDTETVLAQQHHWPVPVWQQKSQSDANYESLSLVLLKNSELLRPAFASHNIRSLAFALSAARQLGVSNKSFEIQCLYGMGEELRSPFVKRGYLLRDYAPVGELIPGMGYLVRRLLENTSNEGFLRKSLHDRQSVDTLLEAPLTSSGTSDNGHLEKEIREEFYNCPLTDFSDSLARQEFSTALDIALQLPAVEVPLLVGTKRLTGPQAQVSISPDDPQDIVAHYTLASREQADRAVQSLAAFFPDWRATSWEERADIFFEAARLLRAERNRFSALMIRECAKPWREADADVAEAIDFLNYYAHQAVKLGEPLKLGDKPGELNRYWYEPRGVAVVIGPWNFPLAIPCGMLSAALVTGNTAVIKPSGQSVLIAYELISLLRRAGLPEEAAAFLPSSGSEVGEFLVTHPLVSTIAFTGSKAVGLKIIEQAAKVSTGQEHVRRVIAEMGGKNSIIVDEDADLDEAVKGVVYSAFGYAGQKCSACSRVIIVGDAYAPFCRRLSSAIESIDVGLARYASTLVPPVIDPSAQKTINQYIALGRSSGTLLAEASPPAGNSFFVPPVAITNLPFDSRLKVEEIFGPVLSVERAKSVPQAITMAEATEYALTGAFFSRHPKNIQRVLRDFRVGNLYINRGSTGAIVERQPFGGSKMSGVGSKAGGPDYLRQFLIPRSATENTLRRGFTPDLI